MEYAEIQRLLPGLGYRLDQQTGPHERWQHPRRPVAVTIAGRPGRRVPARVVKNILGAAAQRPAA